MIDQTVLLLIVSLMFLMVILLIGVIYSRLHWGIKAFFIVSSLAVAAIDYAAFTRSLGWPVVDMPPSQFRLLGVTINEPSRTGGDQGSIFVWYVTQGHKTPRSIKMPYTKEMHKTMAKAQAMLGKGQDVYMGHSKQGQGSGKSAKSGKAEDADPLGRRGQSTYQSPAQLDFIPPPDGLPMKDDQ